MIAAHRWFSSLAGENKKASPTTGQRGWNSDHAVKFLRDVGYTMSDTVTRPILSAMQVSCSLPASNRKRLFC